MIKRFLLILTFAAVCSFGATTNTIDNFAEAGTLAYTGRAPGLDPFYGRPGGGEYVYQASATNVVGALRTVRFTAGGSLSSTNALYIQPGGTAELWWNLNTRARLRLNIDATDTNLPIASAGGLPGSAFTAFVTGGEFLNVTSGFGTRMLGVGRGHRGSTPGTYTAAATFYEVLASHRSLSASLSSNATTLASGVGDPAAGAYLAISNEVCYVSANSGGNLTLQRGQLGTVAQDWPGGTALEILTNRTALSAYINASVTRLTIGGASDFGDKQWKGGSNYFPATPFVAQIDNEVLNVTATSGEVWTITRGYSGSVAAAHDSSSVIQRPTRNVSAVQVSFGALSESVPAAIVLTSGDGLRSVSGGVKMVENRRFENTDGFGGVSGPAGRMT